MSDPIKAARVKQALYATARNTTLEPIKEGSGIVDAGALVAALTSSPAPSPAPKPAPAPKPPTEPSKPAPEGFHPGAQRMAMERYRSGGYAREVVVTKNGRDVAYSVPKGG